MMHWDLLYTPPLTTLPGGRRLWVDGGIIVGESATGGWFAARPMGSRWGLQPPRVDNMPSAEVAINALEIYDAIIAKFRAETAHREPNRARLH